MKIKRLPLQFAYAAMLAFMGLSVCTASHAGGRKDGGWQASEKLTRADGSQVPGGCPIESPAGRFLFVAKNPSGSNLDIYVNERAGIDEPFEGDAVLPAVISQPGVNDFCPTPLPDGVLYFVSNRTLEAETECGKSDIYSSVNNPATGYSEPVHLDCFPYGPNTPGTEFSPSIVETKWATLLFYSSDYDYKSMSIGDQDIYVSFMKPDGTFTPGLRLNYPINTEYDDKQPNVSPDGREIVFASNRPGETGEDSAFDIFTAKLRHFLLPAGDVTNLSETVPFPTEPDDETRPSLSWDGERIVYGSMGVWQSERHRGRGHGRRR